ncbi:MAG: alpha/beta fold hydrolase [Lentisphaeria bacterium]|jgi:dienelactone hydrolase|nr:alpha/beta fold hydrolase [Lentisphaeria bacterium]MDP7740548.1 alpha/beta fold hydrolase [Lentisphaeria bacterium]
MKRRQQPDAAGGRVLTLGEWGLRTAESLAPAQRFAGRTKTDYTRWRRQFEPQLRGMLGRFPDPVPLRARVLERRLFRTYIREKVIFDSEQFMSVPAWICLPKDRRRGQKFPAVLCCHGHGHGKDALVGIRHDGRRGTDYQKNLAIRLAENGFVAMAPDWRGFGERAEPPETHPAPRDLCNVANLMAELLGYNLLTLNLWDAMKSIDYLAGRREVDISRLGCAGVSFGGTMTLFLTAAEPRITAACVSGYLGTTAKALPFLTCGSQTLPDLLQWGDRAEVAGLVCDRPLLVQAGQYDASFPAADTLAAYRRVQDIYRAAGVEDRLSLDLFDGVHEINAGPILKWFAKRLFLELPAQKR